MASARILFIGFDPATMNLDGAPPGTAAQIQGGIDASMTQLVTLGYDAEFCPLAEGDVDADAIVRTRLRERAYDCVVIGAGLRLIASHTMLFEALVDAIRELAPGAKLAFNATPGDAAEAVERRLQA